MDQQITYRVNLDDASFQARLTQLRASLDQTVMGQQMLGAYGGGGGGGYGGMAANALYSMQTAGMGMGGGGGIVPPMYAPPAMAYTGHMGMVGVSQSFGQAALGSFGLTSLNPFSGNKLPRQLSPLDYAAESQKNLMSRAEDAMTTAGYTAASLTSSLAIGELGAAAGTALAGPIGGFVGGILGSTISDNLMSSTIGKAMLNRAGIRNDLLQGSFRFINGGHESDPLTGRGFRFSEASILASQLTADMFSPSNALSMSENRQLIGQSMQAGLYEGATSTADVRSKTKELVKTVQEVTAALHESISQSVQTIQGFKQNLGIDVIQPGAQQRIFNMTSAIDVASRVAKTTPEEMKQAAFEGASIVQGTGLNMQTYGELNTMNQMMTRIGYESGIVSQEAISQAGGTQQQFSKQQTAAMAGNEQSPQGIMLKMALYDPKTGGLAADWKKRMADIQKGGFGVMQTLAARTSGNSGFVANFMAQQANMFKDKPVLTQLALFTNVEAIAKQEHSEMPGSTISANEVDILMQQHGMTQEAAEATVKEWTTPGFMEKVQGAEQAASNKSAKSQLTNQALQQGLAGFTSAIGRWLRGPPELQAENDKMLQEQVDSEDEWLFNHIQSFSTLGGKISEAAGNKGVLAQNAKDRQDLMSTLTARGADLSNPDSIPLPATLARPSEDHKDAASAVITNPANQTRDNANDTVNGAIQTTQSGGNTSVQASQTGQALGTSDLNPVQVMQMVKQLACDCSEITMRCANVCTQINNVINKH